MKLKHGSLFSGIGGFDYAAACLGWDNAFHCEINSFCSKILNHWFPKAEHYEDITKTDFTRWRGQIDVLSGGFPCQPFSLAGQRKGAEDDRYLWPEMLRVIREVQPTWVLGENVAGIATMVQPGKEVEVASGCSLFGEDNRKRVLFRQEYVIETVCSDLEREGYSVQPIVIPACAVGAPHRRDRVWFIAHRTDTGAEAVQQAGKNGICAVGVVTDTKCDGGSEIHNQTKSQQPERKGADCACGERIASHSDSKRHTSCRPSEKSKECRSGNDSEQKEWEQPSERVNGLHGLSWNTTHSYGKRCDHRSDNRGERYIYCHQEWNSAQDKSEWAEWKCRTGEDSADVADTHVKLPLYGNGKMSERRETERFPIEPSNFQTCWQAFPTQSPVCSGNDELSSRLDGITFPKWRQESVKAYGNAVVPALVYEIFKMIDELNET
nr:DNA cytosine methyltransferase [Bacteroides acidifaciens]